jgi:hypothetical protein
MKAKEGVSMLSALKLTQEELKLILKGRKSVRLEDKPLPNKLVGKWMVLTTRVGCEDKAYGLVQFEKSKAYSTRKDFIEDHHAHLSLFSREHGINRSNASWTERFGWKIHRVISFQKPLRVYCRPIKFNF